MGHCKKYKPGFNAVSHHRGSRAACENCVYFSSKNCRVHLPTAAESIAGNYLP